MQNVELLNRVNEEVQSPVVRDIIYPSFENISWPDLLEEITYSYDTSNKKCTLKVPSIMQTPGTLDYEVSAVGLDTYKVYAYVSGQDESYITLEWIMEDVKDRNIFVIGYFTDHLWGSTVSGALKVSNPLISAINIVSNGDFTKNKESWHAYDDYGNSKAYVVYREGKYYAYMTGNQYGHFSSFQQLINVKQKQKYKITLSSMGGAGSKTKIHISGEYFSEVYEIVNTPDEKTYSNTFTVDNQTRLFLLIENPSKVTSSEIFVTDISIVPV
ncbi:carbohydrate binding domain-containing protein [Enterobacter bugandensis]